MNDNDVTPQLLLIVRESVRRGSADAYDRNELEIAAACAAFGCPHPYLACVSLSEPIEVWWVNAFASQDERQRVEAAYSQNAALMERLRVLGARKVGLRESLTTTSMAYRADLSGGVPWRVTSRRFVVVGTSPIRGAAVGAVFESSDGERFDFVSASTRRHADDLASQVGPQAMILGIEPRWSFPATAWINADRDFWNANPAAAGRS
jgi:hypothetical protein